MVRNSDNNNYYVAVVYHPPDTVYPESERLDHLSESCEQILFSEPCARIMIAGDINQFRIQDFSGQHSLEQLVKKSTRGQRVLDVFLTNCPHL